MSEIIVPQTGLSYLTFCDEVVPLLKRGLIPLSAPETSLLPGYTLQQKVQQAAVSAEDYQQHMAAEFERLPGNLKALLTFDMFLQQAQNKRRDIEQALLTQRKARAEEQQGQPSDWVWTEFFTDPQCALSWTVAGFSSVWLGIDDGQWEGIELSDVQYDERWPLSFPQRLQFDAPGRAALRQRRLILPRADMDKRIEVAGQTQWMLYLPPKAIRIIVLGSGVGAGLKKQLLAMLRQDFRYQRIPVLQMTVQTTEQPSAEGQGGGMSWHFTDVR